MDFLKEILGEELFAQFKAKVDAHNGDEANKESLIKLANLSSGDYVSKLKYQDLENNFNTKNTELETANNLIADLKKSTKGDEDLQSKINDYDVKVVELQKELETTKLESAIKVSLLEAKVNDIDYMTFKLKEKGEVKLDEAGHIEGWEETLKGLKTQFPAQFENSTTKTVEVNKLPKEPQGNEGLTREGLLKMSYQARNKIYQENPEAFNEAMNK